MPTGADYISHILGLVDDGAGYPMPQRRGTPPPIPGAVGEMDPSDYAPVPVQRFGGDAPGESFGDQWAQGIAGANLPGPSGYQSNGAQFLTALLGTALKSAAGSRIRSIDERKRTMDAMAANTQRMNEANADESRRLRTIREQGVQTRATRREEAAARTSEDQQKWDREHPVLIDTTQARVLGLPREMIGMRLTADEYAKFQKARDDRARRASFDPSALSPGDQKRLANLQRRWNDVSSRANQLLRISSDTTADRTARGDANRRAQDLFETADQLQQQIDDLQLSGSDHSEAAARRLERLPAPGGRSPFRGNDPASAPASPPAPAPAAPAPAPSVAAAPAKQPTAAEATNILIADMLSGGISTRKDAEAYLRSHASAVRANRINTEAVLRAFK